MNFHYEQAFNFYLLTLRCRKRKYYKIINKITLYYFHDVLLAVCTVTFSKLPRELKLAKKTTRRTGHRRWVIHQGSKIRYFQWGIEFTVFMFFKAYRKYNHTNSFIFATTVISHYYLQWLTARTWLPCASPRGVKSFQNELSQLSIANERRSNRIHKTLFESRENES